MDGHFVPPITIGPLVAGSIADQVHDAGGAIDVHLMIEAPGAPDRRVRRGRRRLDHLPRGGDPARQPHPRRDPRARLPGRRSRSTPARPAEAVAELRGLADIVLCMTVNPGWGGQAFIESSPDKVARLRPLAGDAAIEVDGGIDAAHRRLGRRRRRLPLRRRLGGLRRRRPRGGLHRDRRRGATPARASRAAIRAPVTSCHQARSAGSSPARARRAARTRRASAAAAADRDDGRRRSPRSGRRRGRRGRPGGRGGCAARETTGIPSTSFGSPRVLARVAAGRTEKTCGAPRRRQAGRERGVPIGPSCQRCVSSSTSSRSSPRTRMCSSSPSRISVEPRGGIAVPVADDHVDQRLAGQAELAHRVAGDRRARAAGGRRRRRRPGGGSAPTRAGAAAAPARRWSGPAAGASGSKLAPWTRVEVTTTKKTIAKSSCADGDPGDDREGREPDRRRAAQARPAEHQPLAHVERVRERRDEGGQRAGDEDQHGRERQALEGDVVELRWGRPAARAG